MNAHGQLADVAALAATGPSVVNGWWWWCSQAVLDRGVPG